MGTLSSIRTDVLGDLLRPDLSSEATRFINEAVRDYSSRRFWFNQSRSLTFDTIAGEEWYDESDNEDIPNLVKIDAVWLTESATNKYRLERVSNAWIEDYQDGSNANNRPTQYAYFNQQIRMCDIPDAAYPIRIQGMVAPPLMVDDADENVFTLYAETLIRQSAARRILSEVIRSDVQAQKFGELEQITLSVLQNETFMRGDRRVIEPYC